MSIVGQGKMSMASFSYSTYKESIFNKGKDWVKKGRMGLTRGGWG